MSHAELDVAIVGAGPYALSIASHLNAAGVDSHVFGSPMDFWHRHMPQGMHLKSYGDSSNLFDPQSRFTLEHYCREVGVAYHATSLPVALETFIAYGNAFRERFVPNLDARRLLELTPTGNGHRLTLEGQVVSARSVILAIGV